MNDQEERMHDEEEWKNEVASVINDVKDCVKEMIISEIVPSSNLNIYCNLTTLEGNKYCIELSGSGFRIVGFSYNDITNASEQYFETPYSLLDNISPRYRESFSLSLMNKLTALSDQQNASIDNIIN